MLAFAGSQNKRRDGGTVPFILRLSLWNGGEIVLQHVYPDASHVIVKVLVPVESSNVEVEQLLVLVIQILPQSLHIFICELPFAGTEVGYDVNEFIDFFVYLQ
jgi:hypothetical protein